MNQHNTSVGILALYRKRETEGTFVDRGDDKMLVTGLYYENFQNGHCNLPHSTPAMQRPQFPEDGEVSSEWVQEEG